MPSVIAGLGIADLPDFIVGDAIASGEVEVILKGWKQPEGAVHLVTPPGGPRPARVEVLADFLTQAFCQGEEERASLRAARLEARLCPACTRFRLGCLQQPKPKSPGRTANESSRTLEGRRRAAAGANRAVELGLRAGCVPSRNITMIVPFPAGGQADLAARPVALALERILGKPVIVDNRAGGGGGSIGNAAARAPRPTATRY